MPKKQGVSKTKAVLEYLKAHPDAGNVEVAKALTSQGIEMTPGHVSTIKTQNKKKRRAVKKVVAKHGVGIPEIKAAIALLKACGSAGAAKEALAAAEEIRAMVQ
jgi:tRNA A37 threonylcarbamoyladenosine synthetase subunit TsaC/SUA5/YrdC